MKAEEIRVRIADLAEADGATVILVNCVHCYAHIKDAKGRVFRLNFSRGITHDELRDHYAVSMEYGKDINVSKGRVDGELALLRYIFSTEMAAEIRQRRGTVPDAPLESELSSVNSRKHHAENARQTQNGAHSVDEIDPSLSEQWKGAKKL
jgi:hypothetical protein